MDLSRLAGSFVDAGTCRTIAVARQPHAASTLITVSYPQPSLPWAPLTVTARQTLFASIDGQAVGSGRRINISPRTLAAYSDGAHTLKVTTQGHSVQTPLLLSSCLLAVRVDGGPRQATLVSLASRAAMTSATIVLPRGLYLHVTSRKLGKFSYRQAGYPARTFDIVGSRTTTNNVTVSTTRHTIRISNLPARTGVIRFTTRTGVLAGTGGTAKATASLAEAQGQQTSSVPAPRAAALGSLLLRRSSGLARDQAAAGGVPTRQRCGRRGRRLLPCASDSQGACWQTEAGCAEQADRSRRARRSVAQSER